MRKRVEKTLKELYGSTDKITEPEITPVLEGNCRIQGPVDESDHELRRTNSSILLAEKKFAFTNKDFHMRVESGTCNVCSAPCSSCMHNQTMLARESKMECRSSHNSCATKEADSCSFICADGVPLYKSRICDDLQHAASEVSNLFSATSSHDSYSENAESKATVRASETCEASEDVDMPPFPPSRKTVEDQFLPEKRSVMGDYMFSSNSDITSDLSGRTSPEKDEEPRGLECHGDNISCITGVRCSNIKLGSHNMDFDKKNDTFCSASIDTLHSSEVENDVQAEATDRILGHENEERQSNCRRKTTCPEVSFQKKHADTANAAFSDMSDLAELHLPRHKSPPKVQPPGFPSQNGYVICHNGDCKDSYGGPICQPCVDGESLLAPMANSLDENKPTSNHGKCKESYTGTDVVKITEPCLEIENDLDKGISSDEAMNFATINEELEMPSSLVDASNMQEPKLQTEEVMEGENSESEAELTDVKVCDICGDAGREELLAFCTRCSDGAEHTYCMRVMLHKVPEGDWLCEECQLKEDAEREKVGRPENVSETVKASKIKEDAEVKVDMSEKVSATAKGCKIKDNAEVKKGNRSEVVSRTSKECKQEDIENKKIDKTETVPGTLKLTCPNETSQKFASTSNSKLMPKLDTRAIDSDMRRVPKGLQSPRISGKRHAVSQEIISSNSKKPSEISGECIEMGSPRKKPSLSRESSFKNLDTGKARVVSIPSPNGSQSSNSSQTFSRSQLMYGSHLSKVQTQLLSPHGSLSRSSSFNSLNLKPKVKQLTESVAIKSKISRESSLNDKRKESLIRSMTKSASFKSIGSGHSNTESASKTQFIHQSRVEDPRSLKYVKEKKMLEKKNSSTMDCSLTISSPRAVTSTIPKMEIKTARHDVKVNKGSDDANGLGRNETKKQSIYSAKILGSASLNVKGNNEDLRSCQIPKDGARGSTDKIYNNAETVQHRGVLQTSESAHREDKTKEPSTFSNSRQAVSGGNRVLRCQRCNETGHATQFCSIEKLRSSALKPSSEKNSKDGNKKGNKWKDAVESTISKNRSHKNNKQSDRSEEFLVSTATPSCEVASKGSLYSSSDHPKNIPHVVGTSDGREEISRNSDVDPLKTAHVMDVGQQFFPPIEASSTSGARQTAESSFTPEPSELNTSAFVSDELNCNDLLRLLPDQASEPAYPYRTIAIPELEFIWQGNIEVMTTGNESAAFDGIQAHLTTSASPKVREVATKFPCKVCLEEVSWISSWPLLFQGIGPDEHNIALFFFAKDIESYERSYSKLLEKMLKNDLALRGFIDGVELLIFPSTKLPVHSQRWNRLFFLWGIFKGRRTDSLTSKPSSQMQPFGSILNIKPEIQDLPCALSSVVSDSHRVVSVENSENKSPRCDMSPEAKALKSTTCVETMVISSQKVEDGACRVQDSSLVHNASFQSAAYCRLPLEKSSNAFCLSGSLSSTNQLLNTHPESRFLVTNTLPCSEVKNNDTYLREFDSGGRHVTPSAHGPATIEQIGHRRASPSYSTSSDCRKGAGRESSEKGPGEEEISMKNEAIFYDDPEADLTGIDYLCWEKSNRKRVHSCCTKSVSQASGEARKRTGETMIWIDRANSLPMCLATEDDREQKKTCSSEIHASSSLTKALSPRSSSKVHPLLGSFFNEQHTESRDGDNGVVIPGSSKRKAESCFFPVEAIPIRNNQSDNLIHILSSDDEDSESDTPNLELALGGKQRQKKRQRKEPAEDDDVSASLSLTLAIPTPKEEWQKPILKSEQHLQDRPDVNTALLLFGGFPDT